MPVITNAGGGGGATSDECTLALQDIPTGLKAVTSDSDDEAREGTLSTDTSAADSHVLANQTYFKYNGTSKHWEKRTGSRKNNGALNAALDCGESFTIPAGDTTGGTVAANSLAGQTPGDAVSENILSGKTAWVNGSQLTGNMAVQSVINFKVAQYANVTLIASWALPSVGPWSGLRVICKQGGYPTGLTDGTVFYEGAGTYATAGLAAGTWYFRAWNYVTTSQGKIYGSYSDCTANNAVIRGQQVFTSSGTFTVPANVYAIDIFLVGGGSGACRAYGDNGGGGGGGYTKTIRSVSVTPRSSCAFSVGGGGSGSSHTNGGASYASVNGTSYSAGGGTTLNNWGGLDIGGGTWQPGGSGGSGGASVEAYNRWSNGGHGGSDGADGAFAFGGAFGPSGIGQGSTTRAFQEASNTLYSGGGASHPGVYAGGAGGGANTGGWAASGTGGGGGGFRGDGGGSGGSGVVIVRWGY